MLSELNMYFSMMKQVMVLILVLMEDALGEHKL